MSHPPECEIELKHGPCRRWVDEPDGPGSAERIATRHGPKFVCSRCWTLAVQKAKAYRAGIASRRNRGELATGEPALSSKIQRNSLCPCDSGLKFKKCHGRKVH